MRVADQTDLPDIPPAELTPDPIATLYCTSVSSDVFGYKWNGQRVALKKIKIEEVIFLRVSLIMWVFGGFRKWILKFTLKLLFLRKL
jgi:hypothetical protein